MTKIEAYQELVKDGNTELIFAANVIMNNLTNPARKLKGLVKIVEAGYEVRTMPYSMDRLVINGKIYGYECLESPAFIIRSIHVAPKA